MRHAQLHLVDAKGQEVSPAIKLAVEQVFGWVIRDFPHVDPAMIAEWAEEVGWAMERKGDTLVAHVRYAYAALKGKVRDWLRSMPAREEPGGIGDDLESFGGLDHTFHGKIDKKLLIDQLRVSLNERERYILMLLLEGETSPAFHAQALGIEYFAASKAIQRVKKRIAASLVGATAKKNDLESGSPQFCEAKG